jgi:hypothetical protein
MEPAAEKVKLLAEPGCTDPATRELILRAAKEVRDNGKCLLQDVSLATADEIYRWLPPMMHEPTKEYEKTLKEPIDMPGWRSPHPDSKHFSTVDKRDPDLVITPHCEGTNFTRMITSPGLHKMAFFYCDQAGHGGGANVLIPTNKMPTGGYMERVTVGGMLKHNGTPGWVRCLLYLFTEPMAFYLRWTGQAVRIDGETMLKTPDIDTVALNGARGCAAHTGHALLLCTLPLHGVHSSH